MTNERKKEELRAKIKAAATEVFRQKGYAETKILDIARQAHISPSTIYLYFDGKKQLFASLNIPEAAQIRPEYERRKDEITRVALGLFGQRGFEGTTMDDIAEAMGFSKAALYQYCASKEDLFYQVLESYTHANAPSEQRLGLDEQDWQTGVGNIARGFMEFSHDSGRTAFLGAVVRDSNQFPMFGQVYYERSFCTARDNMVEYLTQVQKRGDIRADVSLKPAVEAFLGSLLAHVLLSRVVGGVECDVSERDYVDALCAIFTSGLAAPSNETKE